MNVSLQLANQYSNVDLLSTPPEELLRKIGTQLCAVEGVTDWGARYKGVIVAKIMEVTDHPNADKLHICLIDDGGVAQDVKRTEKGLVQVVCGAPNVRAGLTVAWLPPGSTVPATIGKEPFVLEARELRGSVSNGMLASAKELDISDDHQGILEITENVTSGTPFVELYGLNDLIIDCENKMFTHRPDCFGNLGVARELAGITGQKFISPDWYNLGVVANISPSPGLSLTCKNEVVDLVPRFMAQVVENVSVQPSSVERQITLARLGSRSINNLVDATNFYMLLTAQPTHAFDYDKVKALCGGAVTIFPRMAKNGEELVLLNGKTVKLTANDIVIATDKQAIALGGIMGGAATEVDDNTKNIIVECANFDMYTIRRTSMRHGIFSDAVTRFNKGQSPLQNPVVLHKLVTDLCENSQAKPGLLFDSAPEEDGFVLEPVKVSAQFINDRLGSSLTPEDIQTLLQNVEFQVSVQNQDLIVTSPFWRMDVEISEDIVEEVGRLYGYDNLPIELPHRDAVPAARNPMLELKTQLAATLAKAGANEVLTYSFVPGALIETANQSVKEAYQLSNALSPELQYYRLTLTPSLLSKVNQNIRAGYESFALFEMGKTHLKLQGVNDEGLPQENDMLGLVYAANDRLVSKDAGAAYFEAKNYLDYLAKGLGLVLDYEPLTEKISYEITKPFDWQRSALVTDRNSGNYIGVIGEYQRTVRQKLKLPTHSAGFEVMLQPILEAARKNSGYHALSKFPGTTQDITLNVSVDTNFATIANAVERIIQALTKDHLYIVTVKPLDIYHKAKDKQKSVTFRLDITDPEQTLTTIAANTYITNIIKLLEKELK